MAGCVFCGIVAGDVTAFRVTAEPDGVAFLDTRPLVKGHVLVVPPTKGDGRRGFFWPRTRYVDDVEAREHAARIAAVLS